jgi:metallophosphoesterase superfamily enzyme
MHGHTWPNIAAFNSDILIMGHQHLTFELRDDSGLRVAPSIWVSLRWRPDRVAQSYLKHLNHTFTENAKEELEKLYGFKVTSPKIILMPAFNRLVPGTRINRPRRTEFMGPMLSGENVDLDSVEITLLDGTYMGKLKEQQVNPY